MKTKPRSLTESSLFVASRNKEAKVLKVLKLLNPKREPLTPEILQSFPAYQNLSPEEAENKCASIRTLARLLFEHLAAVEKSITIDNQPIISLDSNQDSKTIAINSNKSKPKAA